MRICLINDYSLDHIGGAVVSLLEQKKALEDKGHVVFLLQLGYPSDQRPTQVSNTIFVKPTFHLPDSLSSLPMIVGNKKNRSIVKSILLKNKFDIIHFQSEMSLAYLVQPIAKELGIPTVFTIHTFFWTYPNKIARPLVARFIKFSFEAITKQRIDNEILTGNSVEQTLKNITLTLAKRSNAVLSPSSHQRATLEKTSLKVPCFTVPNPFSPLKTAPIPQVVNKSSHTLRIVWIGRCESEKRPLEFIEAIKIARNKTTVKFRVDFIGTGSLLPTMKKEGADSGIFFLGKQPHSKIVSYIDRGDIVALTSYHFDNQPMTIAEGISRYRPILYCDERLTEGLAAAGYISRDETPQALADAIVSLCQDLSILNRLSQGAKTDSHIFTPKEFVNNIETIYRSL